MMSPVDSALYFCYSRERRYVPYHHFSDSPLAVLEVLSYAEAYASVCRSFVVRDMADAEVVEGIVEEALPNTLFRVKLANDEVVLAYLSGKMRLHRIKVLVGDRVQLHLDPYGGRARITRRV